MGDKLVVGPVNRGLKTDRTPFNIDNDSFPTLINAYQWRGRIKRKRGTSQLGRLTRFFNSLLNSYNTGAVNIPSIVLNGGGNGNIITGFGLPITITIVPGSVTLTDTNNGNVYTDPAENGLLVGAPGGAGTINYITGAIQLFGAGGHTITVKFSYTENLPVMGLEDLALKPTQFPGTLAFDTTYSYNISPLVPYPIYDVSFYKNPNISPNYPGYVSKADLTPLTWNGQDYQQFWTVNYQGALWTTNGINVPFNINNIGMQYKFITGIVVLAGGPPAIATITIVAHGLVIGDFIYINEVNGLMTAGPNPFSVINFQTGYVTNVIDADHITVEFPDATFGGATAYINGGIAQYLTNTADPTRDCIRWYDGDPTNGISLNPVLTGFFGWVNFMPPLSRAAFTIDDAPPQQYYLVGARTILPFKDRLVFFGVVIQSSTPGSQLYLQDTVVYSQNGTPFYTSSFTGDPSLATTAYFPVLVPDNQTATAPAYWEDQTGFGGNIPVGISQEIITTAYNQDVIIVGFTNTQTKMIYSGQDIVPFNFYLINSELGSGSTFSSLIMDKGIISRGQRGYIMTSQDGAERIDLDIPDQYSQVNLKNNGNERFSSQRDYRNEWIYFSYPANTAPSTADPFVFPNQTLLYNYRDDSWAIFNETYTTYGTFRRQTGQTWATIGNEFAEWQYWNQPWNSGVTTLNQPVIIAGNQQGFVTFRDQGTAEQSSLFIAGFPPNIVNSPDHGLDTGDYIILDGALGTVGPIINGNIYNITVIDNNNFDIGLDLSVFTYLGGGVITRMYIPYIQTKQFPAAWDMARKTRIGVQQYLLSKTQNAQITLLIFLSQDAANAYNDSTIVPDVNSTNDALIYSTVLYTCPESTNLGLTPANVNLQMPTAVNQSQIWHRINTSLIGDTIQLGFTLSADQMTEVDVFGNPLSQFAEIELHGFIMDLNPSQFLA